MKRLFFITLTLCTTLYGQSQSANSKYISKEENETYIKEQICNLLYNDGSTKEDYDLAFTTSSFSFKHKQWKGDVICQNERMFFHIADLDHIEVSKGATFARLKFVLKPNQKGIISANSIQYSNSFELILDIRLLENGTAEKIKTSFARLVELGNSVALSGKP